MHKLKSILFFFLFPVILFGQRIEYFPKVDQNYSKIREYATAVLLPDNYDPAKQWKWAIAVHGIGELSPGHINNLKNLVEGFDYNNDGVREGAAFVTPDMKKAVNQYGIVLFVPTYDGFFEPDKVNLIYDFATRNYSLLPKFTFTGFSLGGGSVIKYISSNAVNAGRVNYAIPCAPTRNIVDASLPGKAGIPVHVFVNDNDNNGSTNLSVTKSIVSSFNASNPPIRVIYTAFRKDGHGGNIEAWSLTPPKAPGGQGFTDAAENIWQVASDINMTGARQMKSGTIIQPPVDTIVKPLAKAIVSFALTGNNLKLDGSKSTGYTTGLDGVWDFAGGPAGLYSWDVFPRGSSYIVADAVLTKPGAYSFRFKLKGDPEIKTVVVDFGKVFSSFDSETDLITYSDGTTEKGTAVFSGGKWVVKTASGQIINL